MCVTFIFNEALEDRLEGIPLGEVRDELQMIADELIEGTFPW